MNKSKITITLIFLCLSFSVKALEYSEGKYDVIDTGVQHSELIGPNVIGEWLGNNKLLINTFSDEPDAQIKKLGQVAIFDTQTKKLSTLFKAGTLLCTNQKSHVSQLKNFATNEFKFFTIHEDGEVIEVTNSINPDEFQCRNMIVSRKPDRLQVFLDDGESYIDRGKSGGGAKEQAILYLKDKPPIELPLKGSDINAMMFIPFRNQYLLDNRVRYFAKLRSYGEPFYNFISQDGEIERIPQPVDLELYLGELGPMFPMRDGMIIDHTGFRDKTGGMYYLKGDKAMRIYGKPPLVTAPPLIDAPHANNHLVSPDGCSIAFVSFTSLDYKAKKYVKVINVCNDK